MGDYLRGAVEATRMLLLEERAAVERDLREARREVRDLEERLHGYVLAMREAEVEIEVLRRRAGATYTMGPGGGRWSDGWGEPPAERQTDIPTPADLLATEEASGRALRDERLCLTHRVARWSCAPLQGPEEFCVSVVPCQGCGETDQHYHTSDGQSHDGSPP